MLIDPETGTEITSLTPPDPQTINYMAFNADGSQLAVAGHNHTIQLWDLSAIRRELSELDLDWDQTPYSTGTSFAADLPPLRIDLRLDAATFAARGHYYLSDGNHAQAIADFQESLELNPDQPNVCNSLAWVLVTAPPQFRDPQRALPVAEKAVSAFSNEWAIQNTLGVVYYRLGQHQRAVDRLESIAPLRRGPRQSMYDWYFLAMSYHALDQTAKSVECFLHAIHDQVEAKLSPREAEEIKSIRAEAEAMVCRQAPSLND